MSLRFSLTVRRRRDVVPRVVMLIHRRGLELSGLSMTLVASLEEAEMELIVEGEPPQCERLEWHLRNVVDVLCVRREISGGPNGSRGEE